LTLDEEVEVYRWVRCGVTRCLEVVEVVSGVQERKVDRNASMNVLVPVEDGEMDMVTRCRMGEPWAQSREEREQVHDVGVSRPVVVLVVPVPISSISLLHPSI
jgi:hypothetical protein